jgi:hypothetical protein
MQGRWLGGKPQKGSKCRIENRSHHHHPKGPGPMVHGRFPQNGILESLSWFLFSFVFLGLRIVPDVCYNCKLKLQPHQGGSLLYCQCGSLAILKPKNRKTRKLSSCSLPVALVAQWPKTPGILRRKNLRINGSRACIIKCTLTF